MCCAVEVGMFVMGIITLVKGRITLSRNRVVEGGPAYIIGGILVAVLPLAFGTGILIGIVIAAKTGAAPTPQQIAPYAFIDVVVVLAALGASLAIGTYSGKKPRSSKPAAGLGTTNPPYRPVDPNNPYAAPQSDDRDRLLDEMQ